MLSGDGSANKRRCKRSSSIACSWRCMTTFSIEQIALSCALKRAMRKASDIFRGIVSAAGGRTQGRPSHSARFYGCSSVSQ
jgi:hypothetical protein